MNPIAADDLIAWVINWKSNISPGRESNPIEDDPLVKINCTKSTKVALATNKELIKIQFVKIS